MEDFLQKLGLGNVTEILLLSIENAAVYVDAGLNPTFFTQLKRVQYISIKGSPQQGISPRIKMLTGLPGLKSLEQAEQIYMDSTAFLDLGLFTGIRCAGYLQAISNVYLTSLEGLQVIDYTYRGFSLYGAGNTGMKGPESLAPLKKMAGCEGGPVNNGFLSIDSACPDKIDSWASLCGILQNMDCRARPPPPPQIPPSPRWPLPPPGPN
jgi:hypothetical protein